MAKDACNRKCESDEGFPYNGDTARWWLRRSAESAHRRAYRNIADFIRASYPRDPRLIVDYACGAGNLLSLLSSRFRHSQLIGLDGSSFLLDVARRRISRLPAACARRISMKEIPLPGLDQRRGSADLVLFCFPNMTPYPGEKQGKPPRTPWSADDRKIAEKLEPDAPDALEWHRRISYDLRRLLVRGGICVRVEYATMQRHELAPEELLRVSFEEGSLDIEVERTKPRPWFRLMASAYFRSRVLEDVYQQTADERDRNGGYLITVLRAL
jgi:SAM-dependent methyltransferase